MASAVRSAPQAPEGGLPIERTFSWEGRAWPTEYARRPEAQAAGALLLEDEKRFIDLPRSPLWWGEERVVVG